MTLFEHEILEDIDGKEIKAIAQLLNNCLEFDDFKGSSRNSYSILTFLGQLHFYDKPGGSK